MDESFLELLVQSAHTATDDEIRSIYEAYEAELKKRDIHFSSGNRKKLSPGHNLVIGTTNGQKVLPVPSKRRLDTIEQNKKRRSQQVSGLKFPDMELPKDVAFERCLGEVDYTHVRDGQMYWPTGTMKPENEFEWVVMIYDPKATITAERPNDYPNMIQARLRSSHPIEVQYLVGGDFDDDI